MLPNPSNPHQFRDKSGKLLPSVGALKVGDVVYKQFRGKLVALTITQLNPLSARTMG
jgi:hypothetical protein